MAEIEGLIDQLVGLLVPLSANVPNGPFSELAKQLNSLLIEWPDLLALDPVFPIDLPDKKLTVRKDRDLTRIHPLGAFEGLYESRIFSDVVGRPAQKKRPCLQPSSFTVCQDKSRCRRTRITSTAPVYMSNDFLKHCARSSQ